MKFATILKQLRIDNNLTHETLAKALGYSKSIISFWENDQKRPNSEALLKIADYFNVSTDFLLGREDEFGNKINSDENMYVKVVARSKGNTVKPHYEKLTPEDIKLFEEILEKLKNNR